MHGLIPGKNQRREKKVIQNAFSLYFSFFQMKYKRILREKITCLKIFPHISCLSYIFSHKIKNVIILEFETMPCRQIG